MSRAPTLALLAMALLLRHDDWDNLDKLAAFIRDCHGIACPNTQIAALTLERNKDFQDGQIQKYQDEKERKRRELEEAERLK